MKVRINRGWAKTISRTELRNGKASRLKLQITFSRNSLGDRVEQVHLEKGDQLRVQKVQDMY